MPNPDDPYLDPTPLTAIKLEPLEDTIVRAVPGLHKSWIDIISEGLTMVERTPLTTEELFAVLTAAANRHKESS
jgi:hypothetical protein